MYVSNLDKFGHLLNADNYNTDHLNNDMYMIFDNRLVSVGVCGCVSVGGGGGGGDELVSCYKCKVYTQLVGFSVC